MQPLAYVKNVQLGCSLSNNGKFSKSKCQVDLDFMLKRLCCKPDNVFILQGEDLEVPPFACKFCSVKEQEHILTIASEEGDILLLNTNHLAKNSTVARWNAHDNAVFDICWVEGENQLLTASGDQTSALWDVPQKKKISVLRGHCSSVKSVDSNPRNKAVCASGSRDGSIMIWDVRSNSKKNGHNAVNVICDAHSALIPGTSKHRRRTQSPVFNINPLNSVTAVLFQDEYHLFSSGAADGILKLWDIRKSYSVNKEPLPLRYMPYAGESSKAHGFTSLVMDPSHTHLYACCTDSVIYCYNCNVLSPEPLTTYYGHKASTYFVKIAISSDGQYLVSGSSDEKVYIWKVSKPGPPILRLTGHEAEVTSVAWCLADVTKIITCGDDEKILLWEIGEELSLRQKEHVGQAEVINASDVRRPPRSASSSPITPIIRPGHNKDDPRSTDGVRSSFRSRWITTKAMTSSITNWFTPNGCRSYLKPRQSQSNHTPEAKVVSYSSSSNTPISPLVTNCSTSPCVGGKRRSEGNLQQENIGKVQKVARSPDASRVLSPSKIYSLANRMNSKNIRRTLQLDDAFNVDIHKPSSQNISDSDALKKSELNSAQETEKPPNTKETTKCISSSMSSNNENDKKCTQDFETEPADKSNPSINDDKRTASKSRSHSKSKSGTKASKSTTKSHSKKKLGKFPSSLKPITQYFANAATTNQDLQR